MTTQPPPLDQTLYFGHWCYECAIHKAPKARHSTTASR